MLFEPGPLRLIRDDEFPVPGPRPQFEAIAAPALAELGVATGLVGGSINVLASAGNNDLEAQRAGDLVRAGGEFARQSPGLDPALAGAAASVHVLESELGGLTGQVPSDFVPAPTPPRYEDSGPAEDERRKRQRDEERDRERRRDRDEDDEDDGGGGGGGDEDDGGGGGGESPAPTPPPPAPPPPPGDGGGGEEPRERDDERGKEPI